MAIQVENAQGLSTPLLFIKKYIYNKLEMICVVVYGLHYCYQTFAKPDPVSELHNINPFVY